jgi:hypothetical protein
MGYQYEREDIYLCVDCGFFYRCDNDEHVDVPLSEIPADLAIDVLFIRKGRTKPPHGYAAKRIRRNRKGKGFSS